MVTLEKTGDVGVLAKVVECERILESVIEDRHRTVSHWFAGENPDLRKYLERLHDALREFDRLLAAGKLEPVAQERLVRVLDDALRWLPEVHRESARSLLYNAQMLLLEVGDAEVICGLLEIEMYWTKAMTSLLTWDALYPDGDGNAAVCYRNGDVPPLELESARHRLLSLFQARRDGELAHASRAALRARNLHFLSLVLVLLLSTFLLAYAYARNVGVAGTIMLPLAGGLGAALSGTLRARDLLSRETAIERFHSGLFAQLLVGAVFGVVIVFILESGLVGIGDLTFNPKTVVANAAVAFVAGFSEPFALRTVERVAAVGAATDTSEAGGRKGG